MQEHRRSGFARGVLVGAGSMAAVALLLAAGRVSVAEYHVTSSADGHVAHLWAIGGDGIQYVASAEVPKGKGQTDKAEKGDEGDGPAEAKPEKVEPVKGKPKGRPGGG